jgi:hypothetical protein
VLGGMLAATFLAIFLVPLFFKLINDRRIRTTEEDFHHPVHVPMASTTPEAPGHA